MLASLKARAKFYFSQNFWPKSHDAVLVPNRVELKLNFKLPSAQKLALNLNMNVDFQKSMNLNVLIKHSMNVNFFKLALTLQK